MIRIAKKLALRSARKQRHSALILKGGRLISSGTNRNGVHAEAAAIAGRFLKGHTLISFRLKPSGETGNSKPCPKCRALILTSGIRHLIYFDGQYWEEELL